MAVLKEKTRALIEKIRFRVIANREGKVLPRPGFKQAPENVNGGADIVEITDDPSKE